MPELKTFIGLFLSVLFISAVPALNADSKHIDAGNHIKDVRDALNRIKPFKVNFRQQVRSDQQVDLEESGYIVFKNDNQLKWTYTQPDFKVFLLAGTDYKFYDEDSEQVVIGKVKQKNRQWIWQLLFSDDIIPHSQWINDTRTIRVKIPEDDLHVEIIITGDNLPLKVIQHDPSGARMIFYFSKYNPNITVSPGTFKLELPEDVDVIHE
jgi:outer membrane lipoprotein-sorting protein